MDNEDDDFINYNLKRKKTKRKKDALKYKKTCAIYGIFDCNCCKEKVNNIDYNSVIVETINQPSTSRLSTSEEDVESSLNDDLEDIIDVGTDCVPSTSNIISSEEMENKCDSIEANKVPEDIMEYVNAVYKESGYDSNEATQEDPEMNFLNEIENEIQPNNETNETSSIATPDTTTESLSTDETIANSSIKSEVLAATEEEEEIDVVNIQTDDLQNNLTENNHTQIETVQQENEIKTEQSDDENQIIDIMNFDNADNREHLINNLENNPTNMESTSNSNEDEIIDVENLIDDNTPPRNDESIGRRLRKHRLRRRLMPHIIRVNVSKRPRLVHSVMTIDLINTSRDDSIIEITDSPVVPRKVTEVINVDDDDDEPDGDAGMNTTCSPQRIGLGNCPVCLESLAKKEIMSTICGHVYCARCIKNVIKTTKKCPNCRKNLTLKSIHPLFI